MPTVPIAELKGKFNVQKGMGTNLKAVWSVYRSMLCISVCSHMVHYSFINKGIVEQRPTIVTECIPVLIVKTCHTLQTSETGVN